MPVVIPPGYAQVRALFTQGQTGLAESNSFGVDLTAPLDQTAVNALSTSLAAAYKPVLSTGSLFGGVHVIEGQDGDPLVWDSVSGAGAGTRSITNAATPQVQFMIDKRTAFGGRKHRGRTFLPDVSEPDVGGNGAVISGTLTLLTTFANAIQAAFQVSPFTAHVILHSDATTPTVVTSYAPDPFAATLRERFPR